MPKRHFAVLLLLVSTLVSTPLTANAKGNRGQVIGTIHFASSNSTLDAHDKRSLRSIALKLATAQSITVTGYEQKTTSNTSESKLGMKRAKVVKDYLRSLGVKATIKLVNAHFPKNNPTKSSARKVVIRSTFDTTTPIVKPTPTASSSAINVTIVNYMQTVYDEPDCSVQHLRFNLTSATLTGTSFTKTQNLEIQHNGQFATVTEFPSYLHICEYRTVFKNVPNGEYVATTSALLTPFGVTNGGWRNFWMTTESTAVLPENLRTSSAPPVLGAGSTFSPNGQSLTACNFDENFSDISQSHPVVGVHVTVNNRSVQAPRVYANDDC